MTASGAFLGNVLPFTCDGSDERRRVGPFSGLDDDVFDGREGFRSCPLLLINDDSASSSVVSPLHFGGTAASGSSGLSSLLIVGLVIVVSIRLYGTKVEVGEDQVLITRGMFN